MRKLVLISIASAMSFGLVGIGYTQSPTIAVQSPLVLTQSEPPQDSPMDLAKFFEMDSPVDAARALREHLERNNISLDGRESSGQPGPGQSGKQVTEADRAVIHVFNGVEFTPTPGLEGSLAERVASLSAQSRTDEKLVCILQVQPEISMRDIVDLLEANVKVFESLGRGAVIVRLPVSSVSLLQNRSYVRWIGEYKAAYKYDPVPSTSKKAGAFIYPLGGDKAEYRADLQELGITIRGYDTTAHFYEVVLDTSRFQKVAENSWWIRGIAKEAEELVQAVNFQPDDSREIICAFETSFSGSGVNLGIRDDGVWSGHPDLSGTFLASSDLGVNDSHGTHTSSTIIGRGTRDIEGTYDAKGIAYSARLLFKNFGTSYSSALSAFRDNGVQSSNHSYKFLGSSEFAYDSATETYDAYADNEDLVLVMAAGNDGSYPTNPGIGKNPLAVAALTYVSNSSETIGRHASYSNVGPTRDDSRLKPDLAAPGGGSSPTYGVVAANNQPNGVSTGSEWESDDYYTRKSGTSMAAPHVTGAFGKMKQWGPNLHSEIMKALLINTTIPIKDNSSDTLAAYANTQVGYGMVNAFSITTEYTADSIRLLFGEDWVTEDQLIDDWNVTVPSGTTKLVVTLAYNDQEGEASNGSAIKDDLDLILIAPNGTQYFAYQHKASGVITESPLEKMVIANPATGSWTLRVRFTSSPGFGNPFVFAEQRYGLVAHAIFKTPALSLSVPQAVNVSPGQSFNLQPTITNTGGYIAAGVTIEADGSSAFGGAINQSRYVGNLMFQNASFSPVINLTAPSTPGTYTLTLKADGINKDFDNGSYPRTGQVTVNVNSALPPPTLVAPGTTTAPGSSVGTVTPTFQWQPVTGADGYALYVSRFNGSSYDLIFNSETDVGQPLTGTSYVLPGGRLQDGSQYRWNMSTHNAAGYGAPNASRYYFFVSLPPNPPPIPTATPATNVTSSSFTANWGSSSGATGYRLDVSTSSSFVSFVSGYQNLDVGNVLNRSVTGLSAATTYFYRVRAYNGGGTSGDSNIINVTTANNPPPTRTLTVMSSNPSSGVSITVSPNDNNGQGNGVTPFTRIYNNNTNMALTAPATAGGNSFLKWQLDGVDLTTGLLTNFVMDADHTITAVYVSTPPLQPDLLVTSLSAPTSASIGGQITVATTFVNQGSASAGAFRLGFYISTDNIITTSDIFTGPGCTLSGLAAGASASCGAALGIPSSLPPGTYYFGAIADDLGEVTESNESNNARAADTGPIVLQGQGTCASPYTLISGQPFNGNTSGGQSNFGSYNCVGWSESGPERVHTVTLASSGTLIASLSNLGGNDLDVFILSSCNPGSCLAGGDNETSVNVGPGTYYILVDGYQGAVGSYTLTVTTRKVPFDFDGDRKTDLSVFRPSEGIWYIIPSSTGGSRVQGWGFSTDVLVPGDYDGDGKTDLAVWRPSEGFWYIINSSTGAGRVQEWGVNSDIPVPGDYDGDGKTDLAIWRPSESTWYIINSTTGSGRVQRWGLPGDKPVPADYDGDGKTDLAVWRPSDGFWYIINSSTGGGRAQGWGLPTDKLVPGDYDGDGKTDLAVWRPSNGFWYIINSSTGAGRVQEWGLSADKPVPGDYDGDGKTDLAVWRPSDGTWYIINSSTASGRVQTWGLTGDTPLPSVFVR